MNLSSEIGNGVFFDLVSGCTSRVHTIAAQMQDDVRRIRSRMADQ